MHWLDTTRHLPFPRGPYATACLDLMCGRTEEGAFLKIFYPTTNIKKDDMKEWTSWQIEDEHVDSLSSCYAPYAKWFFTSGFKWQSSSLMIPSVWEGPVAEGKFPVIIYSHGLMGHRNFYSATCVDIASHGFVVACVEHRDGSACTTYTISSSGKKEWIAHIYPQKNVKEFPLRNKQVNIRAKECMTALDVLVHLNTREVLNELPSNFNLSSFHDKLDLNSPIVMGHSFGAASALLTMLKDSRFKIGIALDPWLFPIKDDLVQINNMDRPIFSVLTDWCFFDLNVKGLKKLHSNKINIITIKGAVHLHQTDFPFAFGIFEKFATYKAKMGLESAMFANNVLIIGYLCKELGIRNITSKLGSSFIKRRIRKGFPVQEFPLDEFETVTGVSVVQE